MQSSIFLNVYRVRDVTIIMLYGEQYMTVWLKARSWSRRAPVLVPEITDFLINNSGQATGARVPVHQAV